MLQPATIHRLAIFAFPLLASGCASSAGNGDNTAATEHVGVLGAALDTPVTTPTSHLKCRWILNHLLCTSTPDGHVQSETASSVQTYTNQTIASVTFNDDFTGDDGIAYTATDRKVYAGASLMGWASSVADTSGNPSFTTMFKSWTRGHIDTPPPGIAVLWGDPSMTSSHANQFRVFLSNLMVPTSKFPTSVGYIQGSLEPYLGGACIARSTDSGQTFSVAAADCLSNNNHFYDGSSMASDYTGVVYAAYVDVDTSKIDVWRAPNDTARFAMIAGPFPTLNIATHPRIRVDGTNLYAMATDTSGNIWINKFNGNVWGAPVLMAGGNVIYPVITLSDRTIRTGPQFSFEVGTPSPGRQDEIRLCATFAKSSGHYGMECGYTNRALTISPASADSLWSTMSAGGDQFNPVVSKQVGFFTLPAAWKASWTSTEFNPRGNAVWTMASPLVPSFWSGAIVAGGQTPCTDTRPTGGNWTDYDDMQVIGLGSGGTPFFIRFFADSTATSTCGDRWAWYGSPVHVSSVIFQ